MTFYIQKSSGEKEPFNIEKFKRSLRRSGASDELIDTISQELQLRTDIRSTADIYDYAFERLKEKNSPVAARYNLKHAIMDFGPAGFPFEFFAAHIFSAQGYKVEVGKLVRGFCVEHEIDVVAEKDHKHFMVECKFHNSTSLKSDVKVPLYVKARFDDVHRAWDSHPDDKHTFHEAWIITNTKFTEQAIQYAKCAKIKVISWGYPETGNLPDLIQQYGLHPITALTSLNEYQKKKFIEDGFVLCKDAAKYTDKLKKLGMSDDEIAALIAETTKVCTI